MKHRSKGASRAVALAVVVVVCMALPSAPAEAAGDTLGVVKAFPGAMVPLYGTSNSPGVARVPRAPVAAGTQSATINVTYSGFSGPAQTAFQAAVDVWEARITSSIVINVNAVWTALPPGVLGSAGPSAYYLLTDNFVYPVSLAEKLCVCQANGVGAADINANFSSAFPNWYFGTDGLAPVNTYDFMTVVLHELGHGLGFLSSFYVSGANGGYGFNIPPIRVLKYDFNEWDSSSGGSKLTNTAVYANPSAALKTQLTDGSVFFAGAAAMAANGGARVRLYAPNPHQPGSSNSHLDEATFPTGGVNSLMTPQLDDGESILEPGAITLGLFQDIGWTVNPPVSVTINIDNKTVTETDALGKAKVKVTLSAASASPVTVQYSTANGTATAPSDYTAVNNKTLTIPAGVTQINIKLKIAGDNVPEPNETFFVNLSNPVGAVIGDGQAQVTINNDD